VEAVEDALQLIDRNAASGIHDAQACALTGALNDDADDRILGRKLDGVAEQVGEHLHEAVAIGFDGHGFGLHLEANAGGIGHGLHRIGDLAGEFVHGTGTEGEWSAAGLHALEVEDVVDETDEAVGVGDGDAQQIGGLIAHLAEQPVGEQPQRAADGGERSAQLVAYGGDELVLHPVEGVALADVAEAEHAADHDAVFDHGGDGEFHREAAPILAVEDLLAAGVFVQQQ
jgi:hypothetical protein